MISMTRIPVPDWAPSHARHLAKTIGGLGDAAKATIAPLMPQIYEELGRRVHEFANDPDQCFPDSDDFPEQRKLDGRYYLGSESFEETQETNSSSYGSRFVVPRGLA